MRSVLSWVVLGVVACAGNENAAVGDDAPMFPQGGRVGGCVLAEATGSVPKDVYQITPIEPAVNYGIFTKKHTVYGIQLIAESDVPDDFVMAVSQVIQEMLDPKTVVDGVTQEDIVENLYRYRATIPLFHGEPDMENAGDIWGVAEDENSVCDIIMEGVDGQAMEVVEHILHIVTDVGLHYTYPNEWGLGTSSALAKAMSSAIESGVYNVSDYAPIPEGNERQRILMQEFAYWVLTSAWGIQSQFGPGDNAEWMASSPAELEAQSPDAFALHQRTTAQSLHAPNVESLEAFAAP